MSILRKLWWGLYPLERSFWGFYIFGGVGVMMLTIILGALFLINFPQARPIVYVIGTCITWAYWAVATVGVWRSASLHDQAGRFWPNAAKIVVIFIAGSFIFRLVSGGALGLVGRIMGNWDSN